MYYTNKLKGKPLQMMGYKVTGSKRCKPQDMLERHLPKQLLHLVDKARELLPDHQTYSQEKPHERGHSWGDMSL